MLSFRPIDFIEAQKTDVSVPEVSEMPFSISRPSSIGQRDYLKNAQWTLEEKAKYIGFLEVHCKVMEGRPHSKLWGVYEQMGKFIKSRNFRQCKSYHQKMVNSHNTIPEIIAFLLDSNLELGAMAGKQKARLDSSSKFYYQKDVQPEEKLVGPTQGSPVEEIQKFKIPQGIKSTEEEWKICHELFLEWTNRLKNLMFQAPIAFV